MTSLSTFSKPIPPNKYEYWITFNYPEFPDCPEFQENWPRKIFRVSISVEITGILSSTTFPTPIQLDDPPQYASHAINDITIDSVLVIQFTEKSIKSINEVFKELGAYRPAEKDDKKLLFINKLHSHMDIKAPYIEEALVELRMVHGLPAEVCSVYRKSSPYLFTPSAYPFTPSANPKISLVSHTLRRRHDAPFNMRCQDVHEYIYQSSYDTNYYHVAWDDDPSERYLINQLIKMQVDSEE